MYQIYRYTAPDGRVYIGCTARTLAERAGQRGEGYREATKFWEAIQEFGWENFNLDVLETTEDANEATRLEDEYILKYHALDIHYGFNSIKSGGAKTLETRRKQSETMKQILNDPNSYFRSEERYLKQSAAIKESHSRPEVREKLSQSAKKAHQDNPVFQSESYKSKISDTMKKHRADETSVFNSEEYLDTHRAAVKEAANKPEARQKKSAAMKEKWSGEDYRKSQSESLNAAASRPEVLEKRRQGLKAFNAKPGQYEIRCARQLVIQNNPEVKRKKREARLGKVWVHRFSDGILVKKVVTPEESVEYIAQGWQSGMGPRSK